MPQFFVPARSSRHRTACFALYKTLLRQAALVPLPDDLTPAAVPSERPVSPLTILIRNSFRQNRGDTSPRLVLGALENGYKFLDLLAQAQTSPATHASVVDFVRRRREAGLLTEEAAKPWRRVKPRDKHRWTQPSAPHPDTVPLLTRRVVEAPGQPGRTPGQPPGQPLAVQFYEYVPTVRPRPLAELSRTKDGRRRVPTLAADATGIPFLRLSRPQSPVLSRVLRQKGRKRRDRVQLLVNMQRDDVDFAKEEDHWEAEVERLLQATQATQATQAGAGRDTNAPPTTYAEGVAEGIQYLYSKLNVEMADMLARSRAMLQIVEQEKALAEQEAKEAEQAAKAQLPQTQS